MDNPVRSAGKRKRATLLLEVSWDGSKPLSGPTSGMIMAVIEQDPQMRRMFDDLRLENWAWVTMQPTPSALRRKRERLEAQRAKRRKKR